MRHRVSVIFGTRPEAIKLAPVIRALQETRRFESSVCVTGQHREMLDQVLQAFAIVPDADLAVMQHDQTLAALTARTVEAVSGFLARKKPDLVLVQGDTATAFCASLAAFYRRIPIGHIEAGLRTGNLQAPWPEEGFRALISRLAVLHFAPTPRSRENLIREGIDASRIVVTGNTVVDALLLALDRIKGRRMEVPGLRQSLLADPGEPQLVLVTGHRRESFGSGFKSICLAIAELAEMFPEVAFVYPVHLNPNVRNPVARILGSKGLKNVHLIKPVAYLPFVWLMKRASLVLTDSGGIQEEAPTLGKPVLVMRDKTERPEGVVAGTCVLVGTERRRIVREVSRLLRNPVARQRFREVRNPYGDGRASARIVAACVRLLDA